MDYTPTSPKVCLMTDVTLQTFFEGRKLIRTQSCVGISEDGLISLALSFPTPVQESVKLLPSCSDVTATQQIQKSDPSSRSGYEPHHECSLQDGRLGVTLDIPLLSPYIHCHSQWPGLDLHHLSWIVATASQPPFQLVLNCRLLAKQVQR